MSADAKLILCFVIPIVVALTVALAVCVVLVVLYRRQNEALSGKCRRYRRAAENATANLRRAQSAYFLAETQAEAAVSDELEQARRELHVNRSLMRQLDRGRKGATA